MPAVTSRIRHSPQGQASYTVAPSRVGCRERTVQVCWCAEVIAPVWCNGLVQLNPYRRDAVLFAVDLANTPPRSVAELATKCGHAGLAGDRRVTRGDLECTLALLDEWLAIVDAEPPKLRARRLNALLAAATAHARLTDHIGGWHLHLRDDGLRLGQVLRAVIATGTALHLAGLGMHRLGRCAVADCERVFADVSPTGP